MLRCIALISLCYFGIFSGAEALCSRQAVSLQVDASKSMSITYPKEDDRTTLATIEQGGLVKFVQRLPDHAQMIGGAPDAVAFQLISWAGPGHHKLVFDWQHASLGSSEEASSALGFVTFKERGTEPYPAIYQATAQFSRLTGNTYPSRVIVLITDARRTKWPESANTLEVSADLLEQDIHVLIGIPHIPEQMEHRDKTGEILPAHLEAEHLDRYKALSSLGELIFAETDEELAEKLLRALEVLACSHL